MSIKLLEPVPNRQRLQHLRQSTMYGIIQNGE